MDLPGGIELVGTGGWLAESDDELDLAADDRAEGFG